MRKCNYSKLDLARYLQNKMTRDEETEFQKHLITCSDCRDELECMRRAIKEIEQEPGSKKTWIIAAAIACSVAGGVCFSTFNPTRNVLQFKFNQSDRYNEIDTALMNDTLFVDTVQTQIDSISDLY